MRASSPPRASIPKAIAALGDWIDDDASVRADGAEDAFYAQRVKSALAANAPLVRAAELTAVRDVQPAAWAALGRHVVALPRGALLNVNTAGPDVLGAAIPDLAGDNLAAFLAERATKPITTMAELGERLPKGVSIPSGATFAFSSSYFLVTVKSRQGDALAQARALMRRDGSGAPAVVWQTLE